MLGSLSKKFSSLMSTTPKTSSSFSPSPCNEIIQEQNCCDLYSDNDSCNEYFAHENVHNQTIRRLPKACEPKADDEIASVIVTISDGCSYDKLFSSVPIQSDEGTKVMGYWLNAKNGMSTLLNLLQPDATVAAQQAQEATQKGENENEIFMELLECLDEVESECVVINFECCGQFSESGFKTKDAMSLITRAIARGFMVMCSDFSLKALIKEWNKGELGPCPFVQTGVFGGSMKLKFDPERLKEVERSAQLQKVGQLCDNGSVVVDCMSHTIQFGVTPEATITNEYSIEVLTVADPLYGTIGSVPDEFKCSIDNQTGPAGHVIVTYPSGGAILASTGHWISLMNFDVSEEQVRTVALEAYGEEYYSAQVDCMYAQCTSLEERREKSLSFARKFVQQSSPCKMVSPRKKKQRGNTSKKM